MADILTPTDLAHLARDRHSLTTAVEAMVPVESLVTASPDLPVLEALRQMVRRDVPQLPVVEDGRMFGVISRADVIKQLEVRDRFTPSGKLRER